MGLDVQPAADDTASLSGAQRRVFKYLAAGWAEKVIAVRLRLSPHTVHNHVRAIYGVYGFHSRAELMARLIRAG